MLSVLRILLILLLAGYLCGCSKVSRDQVAADVRRIFPGCELEEVGSIRNMVKSNDHGIYVNLTYSCKNNPSLVNTTVFQYTKAVNTGFASYCCASEVPYYLRAQWAD